MATITTSVYLEDDARNAGESMTINTGGQLTIRSDTRTHANAPGPNTGSLGSVTINEGKLIWDSSAVRWMPYDNGSGNVPIVGSSVTQGGVTGYLLGVWASKTVAKTAVGSSMPTTGFLKFREVTGGAFVAGALTGIGASAVSPDVQGWISIAHDSGSNFTVPRLGEHRARGGRFFLEKTTGTIGQVFQVPTEGSTDMVAPGLWIETAENSNSYEYWQCLNGDTNGWRHDHIGEAKGQSDRRQRFLKSAAGGQMIMGEEITQASTYTYLAAQSSTYATLAHSCTYTWADGKVLVYFATGHLLETGQQTGLDFTSGGAANFTFTDEVNEAIRVDDTAKNYFKGFVREAGKKYKDSTLADTGVSATGAFIVNLLLSNEDDLKITANDGTVSTTLPYTDIGIEYFATDQSSYDIGAYPFRVVIDNTTANATLEEIYTHIQYKLRQVGNINDGTGEIIGKTASSLCYFVGDTLYTTRGVFIDGVIAADINRVVFLDQNNVSREYEYASAGTLNFNSVLIGGYFRMYITESVTGSDDYGTATAITLEDKNNVAIEGEITAASMPFTFAYGSNVQGGRSVFTSPGGDVPVTVVAGNAGSAKPVVATGVITKTKTISITLTAETDRAYIE